MMRLPRMHAPPITIPPPLDDDHEDVAWALRAASAQWRREAHADAVAWVRRAAETAEEVGELHRSVELSQLADDLAASGGGSRPAPPPPPSMRPPPPPGGAIPLPSAAAGAGEIEIDVDLDVEDIVELDEVDELLDDELEFDEPAALGASASLGPRSLGPRSLGPAASPLPPPIPSAPPPPPPGPAASPLPPPIPSAPPPPPRAPSAAPPPEPFMPEPVAPVPSMGPRSTSPSVPGMTNAPSITVQEQFDDLGSLAAEAPGAPWDRSSVPDLEFDDDIDELIDEPSASHPSAAEAISRPGASAPAAVAPSPLPSYDDLDDDPFPEEAPTSMRSLDPTERDMAPDQSLDSPLPPAPPASGVPLSGSPASSAAPAASRPPSEPFGMAPSAELPAVHARTYPAPSGAPAVVVGRSPSQPPGIIHGEDAPVASPPDVESAVSPSAAPAAEVNGIALADVKGLQDLPEDAQASLVGSARMQSLQPGEEASSFGVALVTAGAVALMPAIADAACARVAPGEVIFTQGTAENHVALKVVGAEPDTQVALWSSEDLEQALSSCPWVADELGEVADRYQALAGAVMGVLGENLDEMFRSMIFEKCDVRSFGGHDTMLAQGQPVDGMYIVGAGWVELLDAQGQVVEELGPGDFLFAETVLAAGPARATARAGSGGALVLFANRMSAHELLATCPPLIEILAM